MQSDMLNITRFPYTPFFELSFFNRSSSWPAQSAVRYHVFLFYTIPVDSGPVYLFDLTFIKQYALTAFYEFPLTFAAK